MPISSDLFRAILALDSYNRGYNAGVGDPSTGLPGTQIGNATIGRQTQMPHSLPSPILGMAAQ